MPHIKIGPGRSLRRPFFASELAVSDAVRSVSNHQAFISRFFASVQHSSRERADPARRPQVSETKQASIAMHWTKPASLKMHRLTCDNPQHAIQCPSGRLLFPASKSVCSGDWDAVGLAILPRLRRCDTFWQACDFGDLPERFRRRGGDRGGQRGLGERLAPWCRSRQSTRCPTCGLPLRSARRRRRHREAGARRCKGAVPHLRCLRRPVR